MRQRIIKANKLVNRELSKIIQKIGFPEDVLVTLTRVRCSNDLSEAKVFISVMPEEKTGQVFKILKDRIYKTQQKLNDRLDLKIVPKISYVEEEKVKEAAEVEETLDNLENN